MAGRQSGSPAGKGRELSELAAQVAGCPLCEELVAHRTQPVFGNGNTAAEIMFVGEAPGRDEDLRGEPFVGRAGKKLDQLLEAVGLPREAVYITNTIKCRPPGNRNPVPVEIANCRPYLERQIELIRPRILCALGSVAAHSLLDTKQTLSRLRGQVHDYRGTPVVCTYHPAYLNRAPDAEAKARNDLRLLLEQIAPM